MDGASLTGPGFGGGSILFVHVSRIYIPVVAHAQGDLPERAGTLTCPQKPRLSPGKLLASRAFEKRKGGWQRTKQHVEVSPLLLFFCPGSLLSPRATQLKKSSSLA